MPDIEETFGAMYIGVLVSMIIYGITTIQAYFYYANHPKYDHGARVLVAGIWILDTLHITLLSHVLYYYLILGFWDDRFLLEGIWSLFTSIAVNVVIAFTVQCYFTGRIFSLSPRRYKGWILVVIGLFVFAHLFFGIEIVVYCFIEKEFVRLKNLHLRSFLPFSMIALSSNVLISVALCLLLAGDRSDFDDTSSLANTFTVYAIHRCVLTSVLAMLQVIVPIVFPDSFFAFAICFIIGRVYANSILATVNARPVMRRKSVGKYMSTSFNLASLTATNVPSQGSTTHCSHMSLGVLETESGHPGVLTKGMNPPAAGDGLDYG